MEWFANNPTGNPVVNLPGGSGKSVVIAAIVRDALHNWPSTRVLMLVHSRELVAQNAEKLRALWPGAPLGIYAASLKKRQIGQPITYASIQSVAKKAQLIGHIDLCIVDEAHSISNTETGTYRTLLSQLSEINPAMRVIGFSASPYRVGQGMLTEGKEAMFADIIEPVTIEELMHLGHLSPLRSKQTAHKLDTKGLHTSKGDYAVGEMSDRFNTNANNLAIVQETIARAPDRKHWLVFSSGVQHSDDLAECFRAHGISAHSLSGLDSSDERDRKIREFEDGTVRAMVNFGILTTGYDFPALDCIAFARGTKSPGLYLQMAVRGCRVFPGKTDCLVLDYAGVVAENGPITAIRPPKAKGSGNGEAPVKLCDDCGELVHPSVRVCPACGHEFPPPKEKEFKLHTDDIMGISGTDMDVSAWTWRAQVSRSSGVEMLMVSYYGGLSDPPISEYILINHDGYAGHKAAKTLAEIARSAGVDTSTTIGTCAAIAGVMQTGKPPRMIEYKRDGKYHRIIRRDWNEQPTNADA